MSFLKDFISPSGLNEILQGVGSHFAKKAVIRTAVITGVLSLILGGVSGWFVRELFIKTPDDLLATQSEYEETIEGLEDVQESALDSAEEHQEDADEIVEDLVGSRPDLINVEPSIVYFPVENVARQNMYSAQQVNEIISGYEETIEDLRELVQEYEERETKWEQATNEYTASITDLRKSLDAAILRAKISEDRVEEYAKTQWTDTISYGPSVFLPIYPELGRPGIGVSIILDVGSVIDIVRGQ